MKKYLLLTAIVALLAYAQQPISPRVADASAEEYAVYSALIANMFAGNKVAFDTQDKVKVLVIQDVTVTYFSDNSKQDDQYFRQLFPTLTDGVGTDYIKRNKEAARLKDSFDLKVKRILIGKKEIDKIFNGGGWWKEFYKRYPGSGGFIALSRVGFNPAMNQAVVYIQHACGGLCGTGHYVLLEKNADRWSVTRRAMIWIS